VKYLDLDKLNLCFILNVFVMFGITDIDTYN